MAKAEPPTDLQILLSHGASGRRQSHQAARWADVRAAYDSELTYVDRLVAADCRALT